MSQTQQPDLEQKPSVMTTAILDCSTFDACANGQKRDPNNRCRCGQMPSCAKKCTLGALESNPNSCWNHPDYASQTAPDGLPCAYTRIPVK
jgi:hypothetical protein